MKPELSRSVAAGVRSSDGDSLFVSLPWWPSAYLYRDQVELHLIDGTHRAGLQTEMADNRAAAAVVVAARRA